MRSLYLERISISGRYLPLRKYFAMWMEKENRLVREFRFKDFQEAFTFMTRVAFLAEQQGHHPTFHNEFSYVRIELHTHDAGHVVTERDRKLADAIDQLLQ